MTTHGASETAGPSLSITVNVAPLEAMLKELLLTAATRPTAPSPQLLERVATIERAVTDLGATVGRHLWNLHAAIERIGVAMAEARGGAPANWDTGPGAAETSAGPAEVTGALEASDRPQGGVSPDASVPVAEPSPTGKATPEDACHPSAPSCPPVPADPTSSFSPVWTEERDVWMLARRIAGFGFREIWQELNRLPGTAIASPDAVRTRHSMLELRRRQQAVATGMADPEPTDWLTEARAKILDAGWPAGVQTFELRQRMEAEPGPVLPHNGTIAARANCRKLRRPGWFRPLSGPAATAAARALNALPAPAPRATPAKADRALSAPPSRAEMVEIVRNTARPAVVLTGSSGRVAAPKPPQGVRAIPVELATRDSALSVARLQERQDADAHAGEPITIEDALSWAQVNKVEIAPSDTAGSVFMRINAVRAGFFLPPFRRIASRGARDPLPDPQTGGKYEGAAA